MTEPYICEAIKRALSHAKFSLSDKTLIKPLHNKNRVFLVQSVIGPDTSVVVKLCDNQDDLKTEEKTLILLYSSGIKVPKLYHRYENFLVMECISGQKLSYANLSEEDLQEAYRQVGIELDKIKNLHFPMRHSHFGTFSDDIHRMGELLNECSEDSQVKPYLGRLRDYLEQIKQIVLHDKRYQSFCHCDFNPDQVLIEGNEVRAIIDWEKAGIDCYLRDSGKFIMHFQDYHPGVIDYFLEVLESEPALRILHKKISALYCLMVPSRRQYIKNLLV